MARSQLGAAIIVRATREKRRAKRPRRRHGLKRELAGGIVKLKLPVLRYSPADQQNVSLKAWSVECPNETAARYVLEHVRKALLELDGLVVVPADQADGQQPAA